MNTIFRFSFVLGEINCFHITVQTHTAYLQV